MRETVCVQTTFSRAHTHCLRACMLDGHTVAMAHGRHAEPTTASGGGHALLLLLLLFGTVLLTPAGPRLRRRAE
jgi:hypothetical protein